MENVASATETPSGETTQQNGNVTELQKQLEQAIAERKKANEEAAAYRLKEKERQEKEAAEQGKFQELMAVREKERDELAAKYAALEAQANEKAAKLAAIETARKNELIAKIPENLRNDFANFDLPALEAAVKLVVVTPNSQGSERGNGSPAAQQNNVPQVPFAGNNAPVIDKLLSILG